MLTNPWGSRLRSIASASIAEGEGQTAGWWRRRKKSAEHRAASKIDREPHPSTMPKSRGLAAPKLVGRSGHTGEVKAEELRESLPKAKLSAEEEKVLRMRHGVAPANPSESLPGVAPAGSPVADELLLIEMELLKAQRRKPRTTRTHSRTVASTLPKLDPTAQKTRDKILRALRKKK